MSSGLPWFKFYPVDWRAEPSLRMVSLEARGFWIECLCIMHEADPYGHLLVRGVPVETPQLAAIVGAPEQVVRSCLHELEEAGVLSRNRDGVVVCRRMVRDGKKRERDKNNGKKGGNPALKMPVGSNVYVLGVNPRDNPPLKGGVKARGQILESRKEANASVEEAFDVLWPLWPAIARKRHPQQKVRDAIASQLKLGATSQDLIAAGRAHVAERLQRGPEYVKGLVPWLSQQLWRNWLELPDAAELKRRLDLFEFDGTWADEWGPRPTKSQGGQP
jgi:hypothetical protein